MVVSLHLNKVYYSFEVIQVFEGNMYRNIKINTFISTLKCNKITKDYLAEIWLENVKLCVCVCLEINCN